MGGITFREKNEDESLSDYRKKRLYNNIETIENAFGECKKYFLKFGAGLAEVQLRAVNTKEMGDELWHLEKAWTGLEFDRDRWYGK